MIPDYTHHDWDEESWDQAQAELYAEMEAEWENGGWRPENDEPWEDDEDWTDWSRP